MAMPPPIVLVDRIGDDVFAQPWNLADTAFREEHVDHGLRLWRSQTHLGDLALTLAAIFKRKLRRGFNRVDRVQGSGLMGTNLARQFATGREGRFVFFRGAKIAVTVTGLAHRRSRDFPGEIAGALQQVAFDDAVNQPELKGLVRLDQAARDTKVDGDGNTNQARQALRAFSSGDDAEVGFRSTE
jgi:hypothetical protein